MSLNENKAGGTSPDADDYNAVVDAVVALQAGGGGGSQPGAVRVLKYAFDYTQAAALAAGVTVWTPAVDDWLLNAWFDTAGWTNDGMTNPLADIGVIVAGAWANLRGGSQGLFAAVSSSGPPPLSDINWLSDAKYASFGGITVPTDLNQTALIAVTAAGSGGQPMQARFLTTDPLKLVVSDDGTPGGDPFDGSAGAATLYLVVSTPGDAS